MKLTSKHYLIFFGVILIGGLVLTQIAKQQPTEPGKYDTLAQCINDSGAKFYGAFWCPHCNDQKRLFGNSQRLLPYVECSTPDSQGQTAVCSEAGIESYPTWELGDGSRLPGVQTPADLAAATGCQLPVDDNG